MQSPSLPPEIPKRSLAPVWIGIGVVVLLVGVLWALSGGSSQKAATLERGSTAGAAANPAPAPPPPAAEPAPPPPPPPEHAPPPPGLAIPAGSPAAVGAAPAASDSAPRDPNCDGPCRGRETAALLGAMRTKAGQARSCYERALSNDSSLAGKLEVAVRVGTNGAACSATIASDTLGDAAVKSCALARFRGATYPKPIGGCVDVSVPMNFMPAGSR